MSSSEIAIQVTGLSKRYEIYDRPSDRLKQFILPKIATIFGQIAENHFKDFWALKDITFEVRKGETVGIIGRNGSGKSTLLQIICGTLTPTYGEVRVNGRVAALLELGSGFNPEFTGRENVYLNASVLGLTHDEINIRFKDILNFADIGEFIDQPVKTYSSGMVLRLAFSVIAHVDAEILVIDEALAVGDVFFTQKCMRFLREFMKTGAVLFVSHDTAAVANLCNTAIRLNKGELLDYGSPKMVCEKYLEDYYAAQQTYSKGGKAIKSERICPLGAIKDQRHEILNSSNLRNDIQLFSFDQNAPSFGDGAAKIINVQICDSDGIAYRWVVGGENVTLKVQALVIHSLSLPIIGFSVKDKFGQILFGDNSYLNYMHSDISCKLGDLISCEFRFVMPRLPAGDYSIGAAIASGTQEAHIQCDWIHDALFMNSRSSSVSSGLIGIPIQEILLTIDNG